MRQHPFNRSSRLIPPCKDCQLTPEEKTKDGRNCHSHCKKFDDFQFELERLKYAERREKKIESDVTAKRIKHD